VGGFSIVLSGGETPESLQENRARHPRSAVGLNALGDTLYILAIDGRRPGSVGATEEELGIILRQLGAASGLNLDGGYSTQLALRWSKELCNNNLFNYIFCTM
jgi:exopolysaccharide biosynthesis protein